MADDTLGRTLVSTEEGYSFGVDAVFVENMLEAFKHGITQALTNATLGKT